MKPKNERDQNRIDLLQDTLDMRILQTLVWGPQHGYAITHSIRGRSGEILRVETGSLYPALHRLEKHGWVTSQWKQTESNQRAKCYRLTPAGRKQLQSEQSRWRQMVNAVAVVVKPEFRMACRNSESGILDVEWSSESGTMDVKF